jgi:hypothetical protein
MNIRSMVMSRSFDGLLIMLFIVQSKYDDDLMFFYRPTYTYDFFIFVSMYLIMRCLEETIHLPRFCRCGCIETSNPVCLLHTPAV